MKHPSIRWFWAFLMVLIVGAGCLDQRPAPRRYVTRPLTKKEKQLVKRLFVSRLPQMRLPLKSTFSIGGQGNAIDLLGADVSPWPVKRGQPVKVTLYLRPRRALKQLWRGFMHLQGNRYGRGSFVNLDKYQDKTVLLYHSKRWKPGRIFRHTFRFNFPADFARKQAYLFTGFWNGPQRMKVPRTSPSDGKNRLRIGPIPITGQEMERPVYVALRTSKPPKIDGKLDDAIWQKLPSTGRFKTYNNRRARVRTEAKVTWDASYLYIAFEMDDNDIYSTYTKRDDPLFKQEVVEFYIDANRNRRDYIELQVSPAGKIFDSFFTRYRWPRSKNGQRWGRMTYDSGMTVGVDIRGTLNKRSDRDTGWSVEMRLPFSRLGPARNLPPKDGDEWTVNMYRLERSRYSGAEDHAWSPVTTGRGGDYHRISRFGTLRFSTRDPLTAQATPRKAPVPRATSRPTSATSRQTGHLIAPKKAKGLPRLKPPMRFRKFPKRLIIPRARFNTRPRVYRLKKPLNLRPLRKKVAPRK